MQFPGTFLQFSAVVVWTFVVLGSVSVAPRAFLCSPRGLLCSPPERLGGRDQEERTGAAYHAARALDVGGAWQPWRACAGPVRLRARVKILYKMASGRMGKSKLAEQIVAILGRKISD